MNLIRSNSNDEGLDRLSKKLCFINEMQSNKVNKDFMRINITASLIEIQRYDMSFHWDICDKLCL